ncbi:MAG: hypothetical protein V1914_01510 [archaeon]
MKYFGHQLGFTRLIGTDAKQIIRTLEYYRNERGQTNFDIPSESDISEVTRLEIECAFPLLSQNHFIEAKLEEKVSFFVNANAFSYIQALALSYEQLKRGDLYKFEPGLSTLGLYFLPENIMKGLKDYDWSQHKAQVEDWLQVRSKVLNDMRTKGLLVEAQKLKILKKKPDYSKN